MNSPMQQSRPDITLMGKAAKEASYQIAHLSAQQKNALLQAIADALEANAPAILIANAIDMAGATKLEASLQDRLLLTQDRLTNMANDVRYVAALPDPVGEVLGGRTLPNGISLIQRRVPLGVVAVIYEARPNVTVDTATLCLKTGNAVILRGGKETAHSNAILIEVMQNTLRQHGLPETAIQAIINPDKSLVTELLHLDTYIDMLIPRGGVALHRLCREQSRIPVITGGIGVCHIFVDKSAKQDDSLKVIENAKIQRPTVCNALETLLVHKDIAESFLPKVAAHLAKLGVTMHASAKALPYLANTLDKVIPALPNDFDKEWLSLDLNIEVVDSLTDALNHIREHGTGHSDAILTEDMNMAEAFVQQVDSAAVYVNASTRFTDGGQFGLGAEVAVSTQKLHARGPLGLEALTTYKWISYGRYTIRS